MPTDDFYVQNLPQNNNHLWRCLSNFPTKDGFRGCSILRISRDIWESEYFRKLSDICNVSRTRTVEEGISFVTDQISFLTNWTTRHGV